MGYETWFEAHAIKHSAIVQKLSQLTHEEIIAYFSFDNMVKEEPTFCPLYATSTKCHEMPHLNCYLCACPYFRFCDTGFDTIDSKVVYSYCAIHAKKGKQFSTETEIHQDCSDCTIPHEIKVIEQHFSKNWKEMMRETKK